MRGELVNRGGVVLLLALLCVIALEVTAAGLHFVVVQEWRTAHAAGRAVQLRFAAQSAVADAATAWPADDIASLAIHQRMAIPVMPPRSESGLTASAEVERVGEHLFMIRGTAISPLAETATVAHLVATASADSLARTITAAIRTGGEVSIGPGSAVTKAGRGCSDTPVGTDPPAVDPTPYSINDDGALAAARLARIAIAWPASQVVTHSADLALTAGGAGILVVDGDLVMEGGHFEGIVIVRGRVVLRGGARITGALLADAGPVILEGATVTHDGCVIRDVLDHPHILGPFLPRGRRWIPIF